MNTRKLLPALALVALAGCASTTTPSAATTPGPTVTTAPVGFDLRLVQSNFASECKHPIIVDKAFCKQVLINGMSATGTILNVPTTLNGTAHARAVAICDMVALAHFDGDTGADLGYHTVGVLDKDGGHAAACPVG